MNNPYTLRIGTRFVEGCSYDEEDYDIYETVYYVYDDEGELILDTTDKDAAERYVANCIITVEFDNGINSKKIYGHNYKDCLHKLVDEDIIDAGMTICIVKVEYPYDEF